MLKATRAMSPVQALDHGMLTDYTKAYSGKATAALLLILVLDLAASFKVDNAIQEAEAANIAKTLVEEHFYLTLAELRVFFNDCKKAKYGTAYNRFDEPTFWEMFNRYMERREEYKKEQLRQKEPANALMKAIARMPAEVTLEEDGEKKTVQLPPLKDTIAAIGKPKKKALFEDEQSAKEAVKYYPPEIQRQIRKEQNPEPIQRDQAITNGEIYQKIKSDDEEN